MVWRRGDASVHRITRVVQVVISQEVQDAARHSVCGSSHRHSWLLAFADVEACEAAFQVFKAQDEPVSRIAISG